LIWKELGRGGASFIASTALEQKKSSNLIAHYLLPNA
jgi:hypothetical protein